MIKAGQIVFYPINSPSSCDVGIATIRFPSVSNPFGVFELLNKDGWDGDYHIPFRRSDNEHYFEAPRENPRNVHITFNIVSEDEYMGIWTEDNVRFMFKFTADD